MGQFRTKLGLTRIMILTCPSCRTRYQTDGAHFKPPGRNVRCAKCGQVWFQAAPEPEIPVEPEAVLPPLAPARQTTEERLPEHAASDPGALNFSARPSSDESHSEPIERPRRSSSVAIAQMIGWAALILLLGGIGWGTVQYRQTIGSLWPQTASLYAALGLPVNVRGVALTNIAYKQEYEDGQPVLSVTGKVVNISDREVPVPEIRVVLLDDAKHELYHWTFDAGVPSLKPGAESPFMTRLSSPPAEARNLNVRFADTGETR
jgi:predicted Zn finger-like uncharacterized protein